MVGQVAVNERERVRRWPDRERLRRPALMGGENFRGKLSAVTSLDRRDDYESRDTNVANGSLDGGNLRAC